MDPMYKNGEWIPVIDRWKTASWEITFVFLGKLAELSTIIKNLYYLHIFIVCFAVNIGFFVGKSAQIPHIHVIAEQTLFVVHGILFFLLAQPVPKSILDSINGRLTSAEKVTYRIIALLLVFCESCAFEITRHRQIEPTLKEFHGFLGSDFSQPKIV